METVSLNSESGAFASLNSTSSTSTPSGGEMIANSIDDAQQTNGNEEPVVYPETDPNAPILETDAVVSMAKSVMENVIRNRLYNFQMVSQWTHMINTQVLSKLRQMDSRNKYIVSTVIVQETRTGLNSKTSCYWNNERDRYIISRFSNKYVNSLVNIYIIPL